MSKEKEAEYRQNKIGTDFLACPTDQMIRVFITGEILTAENFPNVDLFISYKISLPNGWRAEVPEEQIDLQISEEELKEMNCLDSITQIVQPITIANEEGGVKNVFYLSFPIDLQLLARQKMMEKEWPVIHYEVLKKIFGTESICMDADF